MRSLKRLNKGEGRVARRNSLDIRHQINLTRIRTVKNHQQTPNISYTPLGGSFQCLCPLQLKAIVGVVV